MRQRRKRIRRKNVCLAYSNNEHGLKRDIVPMSLDVVVVYRWTRASALDVHGIRPCAVRSLVSRHSRTILSSGYQFYVVDERRGLRSSADILVKDICVFGTKFLNANCDRS
ncbi:hypothetical protein EVAR_88038_1 [Eumeta japonica]|uniref:Uncharacterized protein n=1 Tax=Eumeta variegata TaxID=151549 RepID=A0A4C1VBE8_EUMVA|nr:hypothetical protein EVAR_88038_1 [Eumeta japonica]